MALVRVYCGLVSAYPPRQLAVGSSSLYVTIVDDAGRVLDVSEIGDDPYGYAYLSSQLAERATGPYSVAIATNGGQRLVPRLLAAAGWALAVVDDEVTDDFAERFGDDPQEDGTPAPTQRRASGLARALQGGALSATLHPAPSELADLKPVLAALGALATGRHAASVALREVLRELYPAALRAYPDPADPVALAVLDTLPEPGTLASSALGRSRDAAQAADAVAGRLAASGLADRGAISEAITALRVAVAETPRRNGIGRALTGTIAETVRQSVAAVRAYDMASTAVVKALADRVAPARHAAPASAIPAPAGNGATGPATLATPVPSTTLVSPAEPASAPQRPTAIPRAARLPAAAPAASTASPAPAGASTGRRYAPDPPAFDPRQSTGALPSLGDHAPRSPAAPRPASPAAPLRPAASTPPAPQGTPPPARRPMAPAPPAPSPVPPMVSGPPRPMASAPPAYRPIASAPPAAQPMAPPTYRPIASAPPAPRPITAPPAAPRPAGAPPVAPAPVSPPARRAAPANRPVSPPPPPPPGITPIADPRQVPARDQGQNGDQIRVPMARPTLEGPPPGSRADWPTRPQSEDWAAPPLPTRTRREPATNGASPPGPVTPPWRADDLTPPEPPTLRLVEPTLPDELREDLGLPPLPSRVEASRNEPSRAEPSRTEPGRNGTDRTGATDGASSDPLRSDPLTSGPFRSSESTRLDSFRTEPFRTGSFRSEPFLTDSSRPESARSEQRPLRLVEPHLNGVPRSAPPVSADDDDTLLIFAATRSAWFTKDDEATWNSVMDLGWHAAEQAARPTVGDRTDAGLPRRVPHANLVPGAPPRRDDRPLRVVRDPARIAEHTNGYFSGWRRGQQVGGYPLGGRQRQPSAGAWEFHRDDDRLSG